MIDLHFITINEYVEDMTIFTTAPNNVISSYCLVVVLELNVH